MKSTFINSLRIIFLYIRDIKVLLSDVRTRNIQIQQETSHSTSYDYFCTALWGSLGANGRVFMLQGHRSHRNKIQSYYNRFSAKLESFWWEKNHMSNMLKNK